MNRNELFTAICSGMASIAGSMMIGYAGMGVPIDYLLAASLMAIPGGILFARILSPATEPSQVTFENLSFSETPPKSIIEAAANGAMTGLKIAAGVATVVMAFVAIIALIDGIIGGVGGWFGFANVSLESIFGYVLAPLAWIMGVDWSDANLAGSLIGQNWRLMSLLLISISRPICKRAARWMSRPLPLSRSPSVGLQTLVLSVLSLAHFRLFRQNVLQKSPSLVYGRWQQQRFPT